MDLRFPPDHTESWYRQRIGRLPRRLREDAVQTAWAAYLAGENSDSAIRGIQAKADRCHARETDLPDDDSSVAGGYSRLQVRDYDHPKPRRKADAA